jgi:type IV pilus assembly protein PilM
MRRLFNSHLFRTNPRSTLGIDISSNALKLVETSHHLGQVFITKTAHSELPSALFDGLMIKDIDALTEAIKLIFAQTKPRAKQVVFALPDALVMTQVLSLSNVFSPRELEELIVFEAEKIFPLPINELCIDFAVLGPSAQNNAQRDILIAAARWDDLNSRAKAISAAGFEVSVVDLESHALMRATSLLEEGRLLADNGLLLDKDNIDFSFLLAIGLALRGSYGHA